MRFLILANPGDGLAFRVFVSLAARHGPAAIKLVTGERLALAPYWSHRLEDSQVTTSVRLSDGTVVNSGDVGVVFNRLQALAMPQFALASDTDREYAVTEMNALFLSWLSSLPCPVINTPAPAGLSGQERSHVEWLTLAAKAGLPIRGYHFTSDPRWISENAHVARVPVARQPMLFLEPMLGPQEDVLVAYSRLVGRLAGRYRRALLELAEAAGCDLMQVVFARAERREAGQKLEDDWKVCSVNPLPQVCTAEGINAVVQLLESRAGRLEEATTPPQR